MMLRVIQLGLVLAVGAFAMAALGATKAQAPDTETVSVWLEPGWNFVGWLGGEGAAVDLYEEIDRLAAVYVQDWDADPKAGLDWREVVPGSSARVSTGDPLWLRIDDYEGAYWRQEAVAGFAGANLQQGLNAVVAAWVGGPVGGVVERIADRLELAWIWNAREQEYRAYRPGSLAQDPWRFEIGRGQALLAHVDEPARWGAPRGPAITGAEHMGSESRDVLKSTVRAVHTHFVDWLQFSPTLLQVHVRQSSFGCLSDGGIALLRLFVPCDNLQRLAGVELADRYAAQFVRDSRNRPVDEPEWLTTGLGRYVALRYIADRGFRDIDAMESELMGIARSAPFALDSRPLNESHLSDAGPLWHGTQALLHEGISTLAVLWLAEQHGEAALRAYAQQVRSEDWRTAFASAFGVAPVEMLAAFAEYRAAIAGPDPIRLSRPFHQVVFFGEITDARRELAAEIDRIVDFFEQRYGHTATAATFVLDFDQEAYDFILGTAGFTRLCGNVRASVVYVVDECSYPTIVVHEYFHILQLEQQRAKGAYALRPLWLAEGSAEYVALEYFMAGSFGVSPNATDQAAALAARTECAKRAVASLGTDHSAVDLAREALRAAPYDVGQFAVRWLAERFGARSILDAFGPRWGEAGGDVADGFQAVFGLSLEQFLTDFGAWLQSLDGPQMEWVGCTGTEGDA